MSPAEQERWFLDEVRPHEPSLRAYLQVRFPALAEIDDVLQESYSRMVRARVTGKIRHSKAFLFATARNAAIDLTRRERARPWSAAGERADADLPDETPTLAEQVERDYRLEVLTEAVEGLPERCRQVVMLRYLEGLAYKEIAAQLGISPETVKVHLAKGMRRCAAVFAERGLLAAEPARGEEASA